MISGLARQGTDLVGNADNSVHAQGPSGWLTLLQDLLLPTARAFFFAFPHQALDVPNPFRPAPSMAQAFPRHLLAQAFPRHLLRSRYALSSAFAAVTVSTATVLGTSPDPSSSLGPEANEMLRTASTSSLVSTWIVYKSWLVLVEKDGWGDCHLLTSFLLSVSQLPWLVESSQAILGGIDFVPVLRQVSQSVFRATSSTSLD